MPLLLASYAQSPPFNFRQDPSQGFAGIRAGLLASFSVEPAGQAVSDEFRLPIGQGPGLLNYARCPKPHIRYPVHPQCPSGFKPS